MSGMNRPTNSVFVIIICIVAGFGDISAQTASADKFNVGSQGDRGSVLSISDAAQAAISGGEESDIEKISARAAESASRQISSYDSDIPIPKKKIYYTSIELIKISWPVTMSQSHDNFGSKLVIGLNKPYYRLKKDLRVMGSFDLRMDNILFGLTNSAQITLKYDLRKSPYQDDPSIKFLIYGMSFKVGMPFSLTSR